MKQSVKNIETALMIETAKAENLQSQIDQYDKSLSQPEYFSPHALKQFRKLRAGFNNELKERKEKIKTYEEALSQETKTAKKV